MNGEYTGLAIRIRGNLTELERVAQRASYMHQKAVTTSEGGFWDAVALNLHAFYAGVEQSLEDIARTLDGSIPQGPYWHQELLLQMSGAAANLRPAVITRNTRICLDEYREFRHVVRNIYPFNLRPARLQELMNDLRPCLEAVARELEEFAVFLEQIARQDEDQS